MLERHKQFLITFSRMLSVLRGPIAVSAEHQCSEPPLSDPLLFHFSRATMLCSEP